MHKLRQTRWFIRIRECIRHGCIHSGNTRNKNACTEVSFTAQSHFLPRVSQRAYETLLLLFTKNCRVLLCCIKFLFPINRGHGQFHGRHVTLNMILYDVRLIWGSMFWFGSCSRLVSNNRPWLASIFNQTGSKTNICLCHSNYCGERTFHIHSHVIPCTISTDVGINIHVRVYSMHMSVSNNAPFI